MVVQVSFIWISGWEVKEIGRNFESWTLYINKKGDWRPMGVCFKKEAQPYEAFKKLKFSVYYKPLKNLKKKVFVHFYEMKPQL